MKTEPPSNCAVTDLEHILQSAVILNWDALTTESRPGTMRIEYHTGANGSVEFLKLWACGSKYWSLVCDYSLNLGWTDGPRFMNGYHSRSLSRLLQSILMNQNLFRIAAGRNTNTTLEVATPTAADVALANERVSGAFPAPTKPTAPRLAALQTALAANKA